VRGYDLADWEPFFSAIIAAAAALTGLLFVAVSINLERILKGGRFLPARAAETLATLLLVVASSALVLVPQNIRLVGVEILIIVVPMLVITVRSQLGQRRRNRNDPFLWTISRMASTAVATVPCTLAGISLIARWKAGSTGWRRPPCWASSARCITPGSSWSRSSVDRRYPAAALISSSSSTSNSSSAVRSKADCRRP
jgi:hypothetical protein